MLHRARRRVLGSADAKNCRKGLLARPRKNFIFSHNQRVYVWRKGKSQGYKGGRARWYGPAMCVGEERGNWCGEAAALCTLWQRLRGEPQRLLHLLLAVHLEHKVSS